jgi:hypothetical protein
VLVPLVLPEALIVTLVVLFKSAGRLLEETHLPVSVHVVERGTLSGSLENLGDVGVLAGCVAVLLVGTITAELVSKTSIQMPNLKRTCRAKDL